MGASSTNDLLIRVERLTIGYRNKRGEIVQVLRGVDWDVYRGETIGLVGESGCGKSTLALALMAFLRPGSQVLAGGVRYRGRDLFSMPSGELVNLRGGQIALIPQNAGQSLTPTMRIGSQLEEAVRLHSGSASKSPAVRVIELLQQVRLPHPVELVNRYPHELSGGQQQRVAIAMALAGKPDILILDEPTTGLDVMTQAHILKLLRDLVRETHLTMIYVSHDLDAVARISHRVAVMYAGEIVEDGRATAVLAQPKHPYTRGLLAAVPRVQDEGFPLAMPGTPPVGGFPRGCAFAARCRFADGTCIEINPILTPVTSSDPSHIVRCHHLETVTSWMAQQHMRSCSSVRCSANEIILQMDGVAVTYHKLGLFRRVLPFGHSGPPPTVSDISLTVRRGESVALVGESGSGKTTIIRAIAGMMATGAGTITFEGRALPCRVDDRSLDLRRRIQLIFQNPDASLNPRHTVETILAQPLRLYFGMQHGRIRNRSVELLQRVRLSERYLTRFPNQLSGGEKQRIAIARAFAADPDLILGDEVTSALDVSVQAVILDLLCELQREQQATYILISHDLAVVRAVSDRIAVLYQGRLCEVGPVASIYGPPSHPYTEMLLSAVLGAEPRNMVAAKTGGGIETLLPAKGCPFQRRCPRRLDASRSPMPGTAPAQVSDAEAPPWQAAVDGHAIRCHIPLEELSQAQDKSFVLWSLP